MNTELDENEIIYYQENWVVTDYCLAKQYDMLLGDFRETIKKHRKKFISGSLIKLSPIEWKHFKAKHFPGQRFFRNYQPFLFTESGLCILFRVFTDEMIMERSLDILEKMVGFKNDLFLAQYSLSSPLLSIEFNKVNNPSVKSPVSWQHNRAATRFAFLHKTAV